MNIHVSSSEDELLNNLAQFMIGCSKKAIEDHSTFNVGFSGGSAATKICKAFKNTSHTVDWSKWNVFLCDERYVDLTHPDSNYKAVKDGLLSSHNVRVYHINKLCGVNECAADYEQRMKQVFPKATLPHFDLLILGMGPDGHICSLFPNHPLLDEREKWIAAIDNSPKPPPQRITMTMPVVNNANDVMFVALGTSKAENLKKIKNDPPSSELPASLVKLNNNNKVSWFVDKDAASLL